MSGHSKWATIKHKKGALDAKRGKIFTKIIKEITIAARIAGGDPDSNPRLRTAIAAAKAENMPADNIKRALQKGTGELPGAAYEEVVYEGYGPGGVAMLLEITTDNKNRTLSEIRHIFAKHGGNLGEHGSVGWMFNKRGYIVVEKGKASEETLLELVTDAGADDMNDDGSKQYWFFPVTWFPDVLLAAVVVHVVGAGLGDDLQQLLLVGLALLHDHVALLVEHPGTEASQRSAVLGKDMANFGEWCGSCCRW